MVVEGHGKMDVATADGVSWTEFIVGETVKPKSEPVSLPMCKGTLSLERKREVVGLSAYA